MKKLTSDIVMGKPSPGFRGGRADRREVERQNEIQKLAQQMNKRKGESNDK